MLPSTKKLYQVLDTWDSHKKKQFVDGYEGREPSNDVYDMLKEYTKDSCQLNKNALVEDVYFALSTGLDTSSKYADWLLGED